MKVDITILAGSFRKLWSSFLLLMVFHIISHGQDGPQRVFMYLDYFQSEAGQSLVAEVKYRVEGEFFQLSDVTIDFYQNSDTNQIKLGSVITGKDGKARLELNNEDIIRDAEGFANLEAIFDGNEGFREASKDVTTKRVKLLIEDQIEDSVKILTVTGQEMIDGNETETADADIILYVKRTFSDLPVTEGTLEDGSFTTEFPNDIPGDDSGNLWIIARIIENDDYGTVEARKQIAWGVPLAQAETKTRQLWTRDAPLWIIISVTLAFTAAWFHYFLSISKLFKIRKL